MHKIMRKQFWWCLWSFQKVPEKMWKMWFGFLLLPPSVCSCNCTLHPCHFNEPQYYKHALFNKKSFMQIYGFFVFSTSLPFIYDYNIFWWYCHLYELQNHKVKNIFNSQYVQKWFNFRYNNKSNLFDIVLCNTPQLFIISLGLTLSWECVFQDAISTVPPGTSSWVIRSSPKYPTLFLFLDSNLVLLWFMSSIWGERKEEGVRHGCL